MLIEIVVVVAGLATGGTILQVLERRRVMADLGGEPHTRDSRLFTRGDHSIAFWRTTHTFGSHYAEHATRLDTPFAIYLRKHTRADRDAELMTSGDLAFDKTVAVEAAPEDVARRLLDADTRAFFSAEDWPELTVKDGLLVLAIGRWVDDVTAAHALIDRFAAMADRIAATTVAEDDAPYRPLIDDRARVEDREARVAEVTSLEKRRTDRLAVKRASTVLFVVLWIAVALVARCL